MLLHTFTNVLVKKLFGNDLVGRYPYVSLTIRPNLTSWRRFGLRPDLRPNFGL